MHIKKNTLVFLLVAALLVGSAGTLALAKSGVLGSRMVTGEEYDQLKKTQSKYSKIDSLLNFLEKNYYKEVDEKTLIEGAYSGLVAGIGDPYSEYIGAEELEQYMKDLMGTESYEGVGITFLTEEYDNGFLIYSVNTKSPAYKAGVRKGGYIVSVDGKSVHGMEGDSLANIIRGEGGTSVTVGIMRGGEVTEFTMVRTKISQESVTYEFVESDDGIKVGHITISQFISSTYREFMEALGAVEAQCDYMVLDLRDCPGGLVDPCTKIADELMDTGVIVRVENVHGYSYTYKSDASRTKLTYAVLINGNSASASEILTVGIKENNDAVVVGTKSYGKGIIQNTAPMSDGSAVKYTEYQYVSASGTPIHGVGITPDYEIELNEDCYDDEGWLVNDIQLNKAIELITKAQ